MGAMVVVVTQGVVAHISNTQRPPSYLKNFYRISIEATLAACMTVKLTLGIKI